MSLDFNSLLGNKKLSIKCPACKSSIEVTLKQAGSTICCSHCKRSIKFEAEDSLTSSKSSIDNSLKDLNETIKNFGK